MSGFWGHAGLHTSVIGVPKTIDGDLKNAQVATSFGFDTACKVRYLGFEVWPGSPMYMTL